MRRGAGVLGCWGAGAEQVKLGKLGRNTGSCFRSRMKSDLKPLPDPLILVSPDFQSGEPVFNGTRVRVKALFDYLGAGDQLDEFLAQLPDVSREHAAAVIKLAGMRVAPAWQAA